MVWDLENWRKQDKIASKLNHGAIGVLLRNKYWYALENLLNDKCQKKIH